MKPGGQRFRVLSGHYAVCRLPAGSPAPSWASGPLVSITSTEDEVSIICPAENVATGVQAERDWRVLKLVGPFPFSTVGVVASVAVPLAAAGITLLTVATYDTDYLLVKGAMLQAAIAALRGAGHEPAE